MKPLRTLIIDDIRLIRLELKMILSEYPEIDIIGEASNVHDAKAMILKLNPDLVFLDIQLPGLSGFDLLNQIEINFKLVFISSYFDQYFEKARKYAPVDFLTKPINKDKLMNVVKKLSSHKDQKNKAVY
jgi:two-component system LytT family response regulator